MCMRELARVRVVSQRGYFIQPNEREAQDVIVRVYIGGGTAEDQALGLRKNRDRGYASPSIRRRSDRRVRHTRLKPTDNLPNALSSFEGTHAYHLDRWSSFCPISDNPSREHCSIIPRLCDTIIPHEQCSKTPEVNSKSRDTALINNN